MRCIVLAGIVVAACACAPLPPPATAQTAVLLRTPMAECYALSYSNPQGGANERMFPTWIALLSPTRAEADNLPDFLRTDANAYKGWQKIGGDSLRVMFTSTAEGLSLQLARADSGVIGRAVWMTDAIGGPEVAIRVKGTRQTCPPEILSAKPG